MSPLDRLRAALAEAETLTPGDAGYYLMSAVDSFLLAADAEQSSSVSSADAEKSTSQPSDGDLCRFVRINGQLHTEHHCTNYGQGAITDASGRIFTR